MRGRAAAAGGEPRHPLRIEVHQLRGQDVVGQHDGVVGQRDRQGRLAGELQQHLALQVGEVGGALHHPRIARRAQLVDIAADGAAPGGAGAGAALDRRIGVTLQLRVVEEGQVRLGDLAPLRGVRRRRGRPGAACTRRQRERPAPPVRPPAVSASTLTSDLRLDQIGPPRRWPGPARPARRPAPRAATRAAALASAARPAGRPRPLRRRAIASRQRLERRRGVRADGDDLELVAAADRQRHHRNRASRVGAPAADLQRDLGGEPAGFVGHQRGRTRVQTVRQPDAHLAAQRLACGLGGDRRLRRQAAAPS